MIPQKFDEAYAQPLGAGDNPNTGELPFCIADDPRTPGVCSLISCWEPTAEELVEIVRTGKVYVGVMANPKNPTQPPICVMGKNPFTGYEQGFIRWPENWRDVAGKKYIENEKAFNEINERCARGEFTPEEALIRHVILFGGDPFTDKSVADLALAEDFVNGVIEKVAEENSPGFIEKRFINPN